MKYFAAFLLICSGQLLFAQQYRLIYDSSTIPELYQTTTIFLQQKAGNTYEDVKGKYKLHSSDAALRGLQLNYTNEELRKTNGKFRFTAEVKGEKIPLVLTLPVLTDLRFNFYTDSIKPIMNFYVNVEGVFSNGKIFPLTADQVIVTSSIGFMQGMEWTPKDVNFSSVTFKAKSIFDPSVERSATVYRKRKHDPRDDDGYEDRRR